MVRLNAKCVKVRNDGLITGVVLLLLAIISIVLLPASPLLNGPIVYGETSKPLQNLELTYAYRLDLEDINIKIMYVSTIDNVRVLVIGMIGDIYGVAVLRVDNPYERPVIEDIYPLTGRPTGFATNGYPVTRIAVGSDRGEILLLTVDKGRITKHLYAVIGADFYVDRVYIVKDHSGGYKVVALTSEEGPRGYPCLSCHIYVFDEEAQGIIRIGPRTGNATTMCYGLEGVRPQDLAPLLMYGEDTYFYDASKVMISYISDITTLYFTVSYFNETTQTITPLPYTLVEVHLKYTGQEQVIVYGVNADEQGNVKIPIPRVELATLEITLLIKDIHGNVIYNYTYILDPTAFFEIPDEIPLPSVVLPVSNVDTRPASMLYGIPPFLEVKLELLDLSEAPNTCTIIGSADFRLRPFEINLVYLRGDVSPDSIVVYLDALYGYLNIVTVADMNGTLSKMTLIRDYVGTGVALVSAGTYSNGSYVVVGLSDGRVRLYARNETLYRLRNIYTMGSQLLNIVVIPSATAYTYIAVSSNGVQVFRIDPALVPVYRGLASLYLTTPRYVHGDALGDLSTIVLAEESNLIVVKNTGVLIRNPKPTTLDQVLATDLVIYLYPPGDEDLTGTRVELQYPGGSATYTLTGSWIRLKNIIPGLKYTVKIQPNYPYIRCATLSFILREDRTLEIISKTNLTAVVRYRSYEIVANLTYNEFSVELNINDEFTGQDLLAPVDIYVDGVMVISRTTTGKVTLKLIYGERVIEVVPSSGFESVYNPVRLSIWVDKDIELNLTLERVRYVVNLKVADIYGELVVPVELVIKGEVNYTTILYPPINNVLLNLPYGVYEVIVVPSDYSIYSTYISVLAVYRPVDYTITIPRVLYKLRVYITDPLGTVGRFDLFINGTKVLSNIRDVVELDLPCGVYAIHVEPTRENEAYYEKSRVIVVYHFNETSVDVTMVRKVYKLRLITLEAHRPVQNAIVHVISYETGETIITLSTDQNGFVEITLPSGMYRISIKHHQYMDENIDVTVTKDVFQVVSLQPTVMTLIWRYIPVIGILAGISLAIYLGMKIRAKILSRIEREEEFI